MATPSLEETSQVLREVHNVFQAPEDANTVLNVLQLESSIKKCHAKQLDDIRASIRQLSQTVRQAELDSTRPANAQHFSEKLDALDAERQQLVATKQRLDGEEEQLRAAIEALREDAKALKARRAKVEEDKGQEPKAKFLLNLYVNISCIKWDYEATTSIKGYMTAPGCSDVIPFHINPEKHTAFETANHLWDMLASMKKIPLH